MKDTMEKDLAELIALEDKQKADFDGLMAAKQKEVEAATKEIEEKVKRSGEVAVEIVNLKEDLDDTQESLMEDRQFLADLEKNCAQKEKEWADICKMRQEELLAIADTIKILNDDDALDLFKKTLASASFLQVEVSAQMVQREALQALSTIRSRQGRLGN